MAARESTPSGPRTGGVSVVLPAFNLERTIATTVAALLAELRPVVPVLEVLVVDDGSNDGTSAAALSLADGSGGVRVLRNRSNLGKGLTVYLGTLAARQPYVCFTDADLAFTPGSYARVVGEVLAGHAFVTASRRLPDSEILVRMAVLGYAARRHLIGIVFNHMVRLSLGLPYRDTQCGLKVFDRRLGIELLQRVRSPRFLFDIEVLLAARAIGVPVTEVPVCVHYNDFKSSVKLAADSVRMFAGLLAIIVRARRGLYRSPNTVMDPARVGELTEDLTDRRAIGAPSKSPV